jgi:hypothetical protein
VREKSDKSDCDALIARIAARQHGVVSSAQLQSAGMSPSAIDRRVHAARLHRIHRGVYAVGHRRLSDEGRWMAAVLACGEGAVVSHLSAAELWGIRRCGACDGPKHRRKKETERDRAPPLLHPHRLGLHTP